MREKLEILLKENRNNITEVVIKEALENDDPTLFFQNLQQNGCQSWMVSSMILYSDTHEFYNTHYDEIENIRLELQEEDLITNLPDEDLKNYLAWLSYEHIAYNIYQQIEED